MVSLWSGQIEAGTAANTAYQALKKIGCKAHMWPGSQAEVPCFSLPYTQQTAPLVQAPVFWPTPPRFTVVFQVLDAKNIQLQDFKDWAAPKGFSLHRYYDNFENTYYYYLVLEMSLSLDDREFSDYFTNLDKLNMSFFELSRSDVYLQHTKNLRNRAFVRLWELLMRYDLPFKTVGRAFYTETAGGKRVDIKAPIAATQSVSWSNIATGKVFAHECTALDSAETDSIDMLLPLWLEERLFFIEVSRSDHYALTQENHSVFPLRLSKRDAKWLGQRNGTVIPDIKELVNMCKRRLGLVALQRFA